MLNSIISTSFTKLYSLVIQFIILILTAHALGPEGRGVIAALTAWLGVLAVAAHLSLGQVAQPMLVQRKPSEWIPPIAGSVLTLTAVASLIVWGGVIIYAMLFGVPFAANIPLPLACMALALLPCLVAEHHINALAPAAGLLKPFNHIQIAARTLSLTLVVIGLAMGGGVGTTLGAMLAGQALIAIGGFALLIKQGHTPARPHKPTSKRLLKGSMQLHITILGSFIVNQMDMLLISTHLSLTETGQYNLATQLIAALTVFANAAGMVLYGKLAELGPDKAWPIQRKIIGLFMALTMVGIAASAIITPFFIPLVFGAEFAPASPIFIGLSLGLISQTLAILMAPQWISRGLFWQTSVITLCSAVLSVTLNSWLIPLHGMMGAVYAVLGTQALGLFSNVLFAIWVNHRVTKTLQ